MILRLLAVLAFLLAPAAALADDNRPLTVTLDEQAPGTFDATWKVPVNVDARLLPLVRPPESCSVAQGAREWSDPLGHWRKESWACPDGIEGRRVAIAYPEGNPNLATILRIRLADGRERTVLGLPEDQLLAIPAAEESGGTFLDFLRLGFEHIWMGIDHLLFIAGLVFIAGTLKRIMVTVTGFTIAHSITLALAALDLVRVPVSAVEATIALSIVFLAVEIVKGPRDTLTWRKPVFVASSFGLLHGFGFAAALREIGLPDDGLVSALLAFNLGIEAGQVVFATLVFLALAGLRRLWQSEAASRHAQRAAGYSVGVLASYWMFERLS